MSKFFLLFLSFISLFSIAKTNEINIYSYRQEFLLRPIVADFAKENNLKLNIVFAKKGLIQRIKQEAKHSPVDLVLTSDLNDTFLLKDFKLSQEVTDKYILKNANQNLKDKDNNWFALTIRSRNIYSSNQRVEKAPQNYEDLSLPKYKGKICTRSFKHPYNLTLVAAMIAHHGESKTQDWLIGVKNNLARKPQGNDREQVRAIKAGLCDFSLGNAYYYSKMLANEEQRPWALAVDLNYPNQKSQGTHVNISAMALAKYSKNKENTLKLMRYLLSDEAQIKYAKLNSEIPVKENVLANNQNLFKQFKKDKISLEKIAKNKLKAIKLVDKVRFDL